MAASVEMRLWDDKYAKLAMRFHPQIGKKVDRFEIAQTLWKLADYLEEQDKGKHEQHLVMLASKWVKNLDSSGKT